MAYGNFPSAIEEEEEKTMEGKWLGQTHKMVAPDLRMRYSDAKLNSLSTTFTTLPS